MDRVELVDTLIDEIGDSWGHIANHIQDVAEERLSRIEFKDFLIRANEDAESTEGEDCILFNGNLFDWKEFYKTKDIILAFLKYFTDEQLERMFN